MAYFAPFINGDGIHIPTYHDILDNLIAGYKRIFGEDLYLGEDTQDYQMLSLLAKSMDDMSALVVQNYNARNPNYATGDALDLLIALNAMSRKKATSSTVVLSLTGTAYFVIPAGAQAIDDAGYIWSLATDCQLDGDGLGTVEATCDTPGSIAANAGTINTIYSPVSGWNTVTNDDVATPGNDVETDEQLRIRRARSVSMNTNGTYDALIRALAGLDNVEYVDVLVNDTNQTDANGIPGHSICALVYGGDEDEIGKAIWMNKAPGVGTHGDTAVTYVDSGGNSNTINFERPTQEIVSVTVTITAFSGYDATRCDGMIKQAVVDEINALGVGKSWGVTYAYRDIYNAFAGEQIPFVITGISGSDSHGSSSSLVQCNYNEILYTDAAHITISLNT